MGPSRSFSRRRARAPPRATGVALAGPCNERPRKRCQRHVFRGGSVRQQVQGRGQRGLGWFCISCQARAVLHSSCFAPATSVFGFRCRSCSGCPLVANRRPRTRLLLIPCTSARKSMRPLPRNGDRRPRRRRCLPGPMRSGSRCDQALLTRRRRTGTTPPEVQWTRGNRGRRYC